MLWIDTDMGYDDMVAVMMIAKARQVAGLSLSFGNAALDQVCRNAAGARALWNWQMPIHTGAERAILGDLITPGHVLGPTGIPSRGRRLPDVPPLPHTPAFTALSAWLEAAGTGAEILALGPLTNLAILILARPDLIPLIGRITWMGGGASTGNQTPKAEFNAYADPEALHIVLTSGVPLSIVDLDLCRQVLFGPDDLAPLEATGTEKGRILADLSGGYVDIALARGRQKMAVYDPCAAAAILIPEAFTFEPCYAAVELTKGPARGQTRVDRSGDPNCLWAMTVDDEAVRALMLETLVGAARA